MDDVVESGILSLSINKQISSMNILTVNFSANQSRIGSRPADRCSHKRGQRSQSMRGIGRGCEAELGPSKVSHRPKAGRDRPGVGQSGSHHANVRGQSRVPNGKVGKRVRGYCERSDRAQRRGVRTPDDLSGVGQEWSQGTGYGKDLGCFDRQRIASWRSYI